MTLPIESTVTLVESIVSDFEQAKWARLPPRGGIEDAVEGRGLAWRTVVVRWKHGETFQYEGVATSKMKTILFVRLPLDVAEKAWKHAKSHLP